MPEYRLFLQGRDGRLERGDSFRASDDAAAIAVASARESNRAAELWQGGRQVQVFEGTIPKPFPPPFG